MKIDCPREQDVFDAIASRRWPHRADAALRDHVAACPVCADLADVAAPLALEQHIAWDEAVDLPPADVVYWRAQVRARAEAARRASLPIGLVQALSAATFAGVGATLLGSVAWWFKSSWATVASWQLRMPLELPAIDPGSAVVRGAVLAIAICVLLVPITVYLVAAED
jgi:hypothetical protein